VIAIVCAVLVVSGMVLGVALALLVVLWRFRKLERVTITTTDNKEVTAVIVKGSI
jgi:hypothetical protein